MNGFATFKTDRHAFTSMASLKSKKATVLLEALYTLAGASPHRGLSDTRRHVRTV